MNTLSEFLHTKHLQYCNEKGRIITESEWVLEVLNKDLAPGNKLSNGSVNQWMNGGRNPDSRNIVRLIEVFGPEVMPYVGIRLPPDLSRCLRAWGNLSDDTKAEINELMDKDTNIDAELAAMPVTNK